MKSGELDILKAKGKKSNVADLSSPNRFIC